MTAGVLGPAFTRPYLDLAVLERALRDSGADATWVGWGFVAEEVGVPVAPWSRGAVKPSTQSMLT